jgi:hypothetical protein
MDTNPYVYIRTESGPAHSLYTVGFYDPDGKWHPESDHGDSEDAAQRVHYLNGGSPESSSARPAQGPPKR